MFKIARSIVFCFCLNFLVLNSHNYDLNHINPKPERKYFSHLSLILFCNIAFFDSIRFFEWLKH